VFPSFLSPWCYTRKTSVPEEPDDGDERFQTEYKTTATQANLKESLAAAYSILNLILLSVIPVGWESQNRGRLFADDER